MIIKQDVDKDSKTGNLWMDDTSRFFLGNPWKLDGIPFRSFVQIANKRMHE